MPSSATAVKATTAGSSKRNKQAGKGHVAETRTALGLFRDAIKGKIGKNSSNNKKGNNSKVKSGAPAAVMASMSSSNAQNMEPNGAASSSSMGAAAPTAFESAAAAPKVTFHFSEEDEDKEEVQGLEAEGAVSAEGGGSAEPRRRSRPNRTKQMSDDTMISMMCAEDLVDDGWDDDELEGVEDGSDAGKHCEQLEKIAALADASFDMCLRSGDSRRDIVESGALRVCLFSMKSNPDKPAVLAEACRFLGNLTDDDDESHLSDPNQHDSECVSLTKTIVQRGGVEAIVDAMTAHPSHADLQDSGCFALSRLLDNVNSSRGTVARAGGFKAIASAMREHPTEKSIQIDGCVAFQLVVESRSSASTARKAKRNEHYKRLVIEAGGLEAVAACLRHHPDDPDVFDEATSAMQSLWPSRGPPGSSSGTLADNRNGIVIVEHY